MKKLLFAPLAALFLAFGANAAPLQTLRLQEAPQQDDGFKQLVVETHRQPANVILTDALYGGIAGLAIGGGVALLNNDGNWGRDLAVGAGAGLLVGGIFGAVDVAANSDRAPVGFDRAFSPISGKF